ncbi:hypothetical protein [Miltoncostaea marina]|uniref:hypothetical protein n=1 Tax=Miltoncostaea marina TaxID=2843215 RepID=UPI001C3E7E9F|nr:hypothetical protein [Miltoncostaea marina]
MSAPPEGLAQRLVDWMAANRPALDAAMAQEGSRAMHEEFLMAEGGTLPDRRGRIDRAREASARAWMRHMAHALDETWAGATPGLAERMERWMAGHRERLEALALEEAAASERRGASGDPEADRRAAGLTAHGRLLAEALAVASEGAPGWAEAAPAFSRRVGGLVRGREDRRRAVEEEARRAWGPAPAPGADQVATAAPEPDAERVREAAAVWSHVRILTEALEAALASRPGAPA